MRKRMNKTKEQQAQEYAENNWTPLRACEWDKEYVTEQLEDAWLDGYTAAEQSMWRSVEDELPKFGRRVLICERVADRQKVFIGRRIQFSNGDWGWSQSTKESVTHWRELPSLPDTNTEKK